MGESNGSSRVTELAELNIECSHASESMALIKVFLDWIKECDAKINQTLQGGDPIFFYVWPHPHFMV